MEFKYNVYDEGELIEIAENMAVLAMKLGVNSTLLLTNLDKHNNAIIIATNAAIITLIESNDIKIKAPF